jgi:hypothetical protein
MRDEKRLDIIERVYRSELTVVEAARAMGLSERQCYRIRDHALGKARRDDWVATHKLIHHTGGGARTSG